MKWSINPASFTLWLSADDTSQWANRPKLTWPCTTLGGHAVRVHFDSGGLCDLTIGGRAGADCDANELSAMVADFMGGLLPVSHPSYFVAVGQFKE